MANGTKELNTSPITIEDEISEFSEKPVKGKTLYKKLKELEDGGGGAVLRIALDQITSTLDKTWREISDCFANGGYAYIAVVFSLETAIFMPIVGVSYGDSTYYVAALSGEGAQIIEFVCSAPDEHPSSVDGGES